MNKKILDEANKLIKKDFLNDTNLKGVSLYRATEHVPKGPITYDFCLIFVLQGKKIGYIPDKVFEYNSENYLVVPTTIPFECETFASEEEPFIGMAIEIDINLMQNIITTIDAESAKKCKTVHCGVFQDKITDDIEDNLYRLLKVLQSPLESKILGEPLLKELFYRIATGENAGFLHKMFLKRKQEARIAKALQTIHDNFNKQLDVPSLAKSEDMSVSSFHTHFKKITSYSPLQYIKKIRLNRAKDLIEQENFQVNNTAYAVGYESISQFSRDFKSYYGYPPKEAKPL